MHKILLPCGGTGLFDNDSGCSYICVHCYTTVGSVAMPRSCHEARAKYDMLEALGSKIRWDFVNGREIMTE